MTVIKNLGRHSQARNSALSRKVLRVLPVIFNWTLEGDPVSEEAIWELPVP
jgi:hypothetical protein